jgi:hypothetical protein
MAQALDPSDIVTYRELIITNSIQLDTITQLLIEKGLIGYDESNVKLKAVQAEYLSRQQT